MVRTATFTVMVALLSFAGAGAAELAVKSGDVIVFLGDEVTDEYGGAQRPDHLCYPTMVESFLTVRYPGMQATYYNDAMADATAANTLERLKRDVLPQKPTVAVVCLGLHDAGLKAFDEGLLNAHKEAMRKLVTALKEAGARVYLMSPPSVDEHSPGAATLRQVNYNDTLAKYVAVQREIAAAEKSQFIDWFGVSTEIRQRTTQKRPDFAFSPDGFRHSLRSQALAASLVLEALGAEPIDVQINMDWKAGTINCNASEATLKTEADGSRVIYVAKLPLPWPSFVGQTDMFAVEWEAAKWCRYMLKVANAPAMGVMIAEGDRQVPVMPQQLEIGMNLAGIDPLRSIQAAQDLSNLIRRKDYTRTHAWRDQELQPVKEPELADAQKTLVSAWYKYVAGYEKMIARMPKVFDLTIKLTELKLTLPTTQPVPAPPPPPPTQPAR